jgi:hypothetical protein
MQAMMSNVGNLNPSMMQQAMQQMQNMSPADMAAMKRQADSMDPAALASQAQEAQKIMSAREKYVIDVSAASELGCHVNGYVGQPVVEMACSG